MTRQQQEAFIEEPRRVRVWCRGVGCGRELTDPISRLRKLGPECDPDRRTTLPAHDVDQDPIPGL